MMKLMKAIAAAAALISLGSIVSQPALADSTTLHPVTWKGPMYEYLVEYPKDVQHIHQKRFEEILDTAGQHGWKLITVTSAFHFYAFYFERPLHPNKLEKHRARLKVVKDERAKKEAAIMAQIAEAQKEQLKLQAAYDARLKQTNKDLQKNIQLEQKAADLAKPK